MAKVLTDHFSGSERVEAVVLGRPTRGISCLQDKVLPLPWNWPVSTSLRRRMQEIVSCSQPQPGIAGLVLTAAGRGLHTTNSALQPPRLKWPNPLQGRYRNKPARSLTVPCQQSLYARVRRQRPIQSFLTPQPKAGS